MKRRADLIWATAGEGGLVLVIAVLAWATRQPLIFASLGPTAYELVEQPQIRSARTYNVIVGHLVGLGVGFLSIFLFHAWTSPNAIASRVLTHDRLWAVVFGAALTTFLNLILKAGQPAALATCLLVALGTMETRRDALAIIVGVLLIAAIGEPVRRFRLAYTKTRPVVGKVGRPGRRALS